MAPSTQLPPEHWSPPAEWGPAPEGWAFYVDGANRVVPAPLGAWRPGGGGFAGGGYAAPDPWAAQTQAPDPWAGAPGGGPGGFPPPAQGAYPGPGYQPPGQAGYQPPGPGGWQPPVAKRGVSTPLIVGGVVLLLVLAGGGFLLSRRGATPGPVATATTSPQTPLITSAPPTTRPPTTQPTASDLPTSAGPTSGPGASPGAAGPELTETQLRAMLAGRKLGGVDGLYVLRKPNWTPKPTSVTATLPECVTYLSFEAANNTWYAQDTDATSAPAVFLYVYTSAKAKAEQIPLDLACGKALESKGDTSWVFKSRTKFGDKIEVLSWDSDGDRVTEYHYGNIRFAKLGDPDQAFATAVVAQIDGAAK